MLSEAPASTPNRLSRSGSSAARCLTVDSRRESANLLRRLSCCVRQSLRLPMREMQRSFHSPLRPPCRIAREPATTLQSALTLQSSGTRLSLRSFLTPHFHVGRHGRQQRMDRGDGNRLVSFRCRQQAHRGFHLLQFVFGVGADQSGQRGAQQGNVGLSFPHRVVRTCLYVVGQHLASVRRCVLRVFVPAINACEYSSVHVFLRSCLPPNIPVNGTGGKRRFTNQAASRAGPLPCTFCPCAVRTKSAASAAGIQRSPRNFRSFTGITRSCSFLYGWRAAHAARSSAVSKAYCRHPLPKRYTRAASVGMLGCCCVLISVSVVAPGRTRRSCVTCAKSRAGPTPQSLAGMCSFSRPHVLQNPSAPGPCGCGQSFFAVPVSGIISSPQLSQIIHV